MVESHARTPLEASPRPRRHKTYGKPNVRNGRIEIDLVAARAAVCGSGPNHRHKFDSGDRSSPNDFYRTTTKGEKDWPQKGLSHGPSPRNLEVCGQCLHPQRFHARDSG